MVACKISQHHDWGGSLLKEFNVTDRLTVLVRLLRRSQVLQMEHFNAATKGIRLLRE